MGYSTVLIVGVLSILVMSFTAIHAIVKISRTSNEGKE